MTVLALRRIIFAAGGGLKNLRLSNLTSNVTEGVVCVTAISALGSNANNTFSYVGSKVGKTGGS